MTAVASLVYEANMNALEILKELTFKQFGVTVSPKQILLIETNHVSLTVWNIVPIRRNFIFGTLGLTELSKTFACIKDWDIAIFLNKFSEESIGSQTRQHGSLVTKIITKLTKMVSKNDTNLTLSP
ncbi:hypothetical protein TNCV_4935511 [Trichonephila clavipes]|nr:hypothetical protein TNCV_4935511 [Trichonephila clavipes]